MWVLFLVLISVLPLTSLLHPGIFLGHDAPDHVARIANFFLSLSEGHIVPRWAGNLNWGFGHPILMFLYPLSSYVASGFHGVGFSFVDSTKLVFAIAYVASIVTMFFWLRAGWGLRVGIVGSLLYGFAPYRFIDLYVRGAIGEHVAFVFPPLILYSLLRLAQSKRATTSYVLMLSFSTAALILSHNAVSFMFLPIIGLYVAYLYFFEAKRRALYIVTSVIGLSLGFALSAFFWIPAFFEGKYTLRDIVTRGEFGNRFVPWTWFFYSPWSYAGTAEFSKEIGLAHWLGLGFASVLFFTSKLKSEKWFLGVALLLFLTSLWLMTNLSAPIWQSVSILQKFQFPWRFLTITTFISSTIAAIGIIGMVRSKYLLLIFVIAAILGTTGMWKAKGYAIYSDTYYTGIYDGTTDTGESSPIWSIRFMEKRAQAPMELVEGEAQISVQKRLSTYHQYKITVQKRSRFVENTLYFPGWKVQADGRSLPVEFQDPNHRGLLTFWLEPGEHLVTVQFVNTKLRTVANIVSGVALAVVVIALAVRSKLNV